MPHMSDDPADDSRHSKRHPTLPMKPLDPTAVSDGATAGCNRVRIASTALAYEEPRLTRPSEQAVAALSVDATRRGFTVDFDESESESQPEEAGDSAREIVGSNGYARLRKPRAREHVSDQDEDMTEPRTERHFVAPTPMTTMQTEVYKPDPKKQEIYLKHCKSSVFGGAPQIRRKLRPVIKPETVVPIVPIEEPQDSGDERLETQTEAEEVPTDEEMVELPVIIDVATAQALKKAKAEARWAQKKPAVLEGERLAAKTVAERQAKEEAEARVAQEDTEVAEILREVEKERAARAARLKIAAAERANESKVKTAVPRESTASPVQKQSSLDSCSETPQARIKQEEAELLQRFEEKRVARLEKAQQADQARRKAAEIKAMKQQRAARLEKKANQQKPLFDWAALKDSLPKTEQTQRQTPRQVVIPTNSLADTEHGLRSAPLSSGVRHQAIPVNTQTPPLKVLSRMALQHETLRTVFNPYYRPDLDLGAAAQQIHIHITAAQGAIRHWRMVGEQRLTELVEQKNPVLLQHMQNLNRDMSFIADFLSAGRPDWKLTDLPHNFYDDVGVILAQIFPGIAALAGWRILGKLDMAHEALVKIRGQILGLKEARLAIENESGAEATNDAEGCGTTDAAKAMKEASMSDVSATSEDSMER